MTAQRFSVAPSFFGSGSLLFAGTPTRRNVRFGLAFGLIAVVTAF